MPDRQFGGVVGLCVAGPSAGRKGGGGGFSTPAKPPRESANPRMDSEGASGCTRSTARATAPSPGQPTPGVVKQDKSSGGSVDTTKTRSGPQGVRMGSGERPMGTANGEQSNTMTSCHPPPPTPLLSPISYICIIQLYIDELSPANPLIPSIALASRT